MGILYRIKIFPDDIESFNGYVGYSKDKYLGYTKEKGFYITNQYGASVISEIYLNDDKLINYLKLFKGKYQLEKIKGKIIFANWYSRQ